MILSTERKKFNKWAEEHKFQITLDKEILWEGLPIYSIPFTQGAWMAWIAGVMEAEVGFSNRISEIYKSGFNDGLRCPKE